MALTFTNEFSVTADVATTYTALLDLERVAGCLPGATIDPAPREDGGYAGKMRMKLGPVTIDYAGVARVVETDAVSRVTTIKISARETRGSGSVAATIRSLLADEGSGTHVTVETDLTITGRAAQFGRGIVQDVATALLRDFATCLSARLSDGEGSLSPAAEAPGVGAGRLLGIVVQGRARKLADAVRGAERSDENESR